MGEDGRGAPWRWREATIAFWVFAVPTGLVSTWLNERSVPLRSFVTVMALACLIGYAMSLPLSRQRSRIAKTATACRVGVAVVAAWALAVGASAFDVIDMSLSSLFVAPVVLWVGLSVSTGLHPLATSTAVLRVTAPTEPPMNPATIRGRLASSSKRLVDIAGASLALLLVSPVLAITAIAIKRSDGGPVLFRQSRIGRDGDVFPMLKFRSMVANAEALKIDLTDKSDRSGPLFKMTDDPRVTRIGRIIRELSIDELPQLVNIVRGDMSLVGPRPALPDEFAQFDDQLKDRVMVPPGLTGLWQAEARADANFGRFRELDLRYVSTATARLDLMIILATVSDVLTAIVRVPLRSIGINVGRCDGIVSTQGSASANGAIDLRSESNESADSSSAIPDQAA